MNRNERNRSNPGSRAALCGMMAALACVFLILTIVPAFRYALPALAGAVMIPVVIELNIKSGWLTYAAVSLLILILPPVSIDARILFIAFFGYYPIVKCPIERKLARGRLRAAEWLAKFGIFNAGVIGAFFVLIRFFDYGTDVFTIGGFNMAWLFLVIGNLVFIIYDLALTRALSAYVALFHPRVSRWFRL